MPNGGSDCCGACWFNRSLEGRRGGSNFNRDIPSHCEIRDLDIPNPFYTYCANHPYHRPGRDQIPIGPVFVHRDVMPKETAAKHKDSSSSEPQRMRWHNSPDTEEIRQHLLDLVRLPETHIDEGYHFHTHPSWTAALLQLLEWRDERLLPTLEEVSQHPSMVGHSAEIEETMRFVRKRLED